MRTVCGHCECLCAPSERDICGACAEPVCAECYAEIDGECLVPSTTATLGELAEPDRRRILDVVGGLLDLLDRFERPSVVSWDEERRVATVRGGVACPLPSAPLPLPPSRWPR